VREGGVDVKEFVVRFERVVTTDVEFGARDAAEAFRLAREQALEHGRPMSVRECGQDPGDALEPDGSCEFCGAVRLDDGSGATLHLHHHGEEGNYCYLCDGCAEQAGILRGAP
jgi:hypothetical protein